MYRLEVSADFTIEDVKDELASFQGMPPSEEIRLMFAGKMLHDQRGQDAASFARFADSHSAGRHGAGRLLQDAHTLREYNIQKPSVLLMLPPATDNRLLPFVHRCSENRCCHR